jgi:hypothetical protein
MYSRLLLGMLVIGSLCAAVCCCQPEWARTLGCDVWNVPALEAEIEAQQERSDAMEEGRDEVLRRIDTKLGWAEDVFAGHLDLMTAAAHFRDLTSEEAKLRHFLAVVYPDAGEDERFCRAVISWVHALQDVHPPKEVERTVARLNAELDERLRREGTITLPQ